MKRIFKILLSASAALLLSANAVACRCADPFPTIDSLPQLARYQFIALVKILDDKDFQEASRRAAAIGQLSFTIIEQFRGEPVTQVLEYSKYTSCDMGIDPGEEWVLFAYIRNGRLVIAPCDRNRLYKDTFGMRDWQYDCGIYELRQLRKLYNHPNPEPVTGVYRAYFPHGQLEIEAHYANGRLHGERKVWYPDGVLRAFETYINDSLDGKAKWFHPNGQIYTEKYYVKGKPCNVYRVYNMYADKLPSGTLLPRMEVVYDYEGNAIVMRDYYDSGHMQRETFINHENNTRLSIFYYDNGKVAAIEQHRRDKLYGLQQRYNEEGFPERG